MAAAGGISSIEDHKTEHEDEQKDEVHGKPSQEVFKREPKYLDQRAERAGYFEREEYSQPQEQHKNPKMFFKFQFS